MNKSEEAKRIKKILVFWEKFGLKTHKNAIKVFIPSFLLFFILTGIFAHTTMPLSAPVLTRTPANTDINQAAIKIKQKNNKKIGETLKDTQNFQESVISSQNTAAGIYMVTRIVDGDTLDVKINGKIERIRLIGINAPELSKCFGLQASNKAKELLTGKNVLLESDESQGDKDKYGRLLRYVFFEDGTNFNKLMVSEGYAREYTYHLPYKYQQEFRQAQKKAMKAKKGLWGDNVCQKKQDNI